MLKAFKLRDTPTHIHNEEWSWMIASAPEEDPARDIEHVVDAKVYVHNHEPEQKKEGGEAEVDNRPLPSDENERFPDADSDASLIQR